MLVTSFKIKLKMFSIEMQFQLTPLTFFLSKGRCRWTVLILIVINFIMFLILIFNFAFIALSNSKNIKKLNDFDLTPRHVHLSLKYQNQMTITWSTRHKPEISFVQYGTTNLTLTKQQNGTVDMLTSIGDQVTQIQFIHEVTLTNLIAEQQYYYRCTSQGNQSEPVVSKIFEFKTPPNGPKWSRPGPNLLLYGDLGHENSVSLPFLQNEVDTGQFDAIVHVGDIAYDLNSNGGQVGDLFMEAIEPIASRLPYQVCPGNHEVDEKLDYNDYKKRFRMSQEHDSLWYSWNLGLVHFISINTENYFFTPQLTNQQFNWLENDLLKANKMRDIRPWVIIYGHSPMYCSPPKSWQHICTNQTNPVRVGLNNESGLEELFYKNGVDLLLWGHEHDYEVSWPVYNYTVLNGSTDEPYKNPRAPVHVITGAAGSKFPSDGFDETVGQPSWSRRRMTVFGYSRLKIENETHLLYQQIDVSDPGSMEKVIDEFKLIREDHGPFG